MENNGIIESLFNIFIEKGIVNIISFHNYCLLSERLYMLNIKYTVEFKDGLFLFKKSADREDVESD